MQEKIRDELANKEKFLCVRIKTFEKKEFSLSERLQKMRDDLLKSSKK